jgi:hypothetical protein
MTFYKTSCGNYRRLALPVTLTPRIFHVRDKKQTKNWVCLKRGTARPDRVHRMDAGWLPEAFEVCRVEGR